jgi:hypothetical protein
VAYQVCGLHTTISTHGLNIAGGAAGGALLATGYAIMKKGHAATLEPGDDLNLSLDADLLMPAAVEPAPKPKMANLRGLDFNVKKSKLIKDGLDGHLVRMDVSIVNRSNRTLRSIDLYLADSNGNMNPICSGPDEEDDPMFTLEPGTQKDARLFFEVKWPKLKRTIVWLNHETRQICYRQDLQ